MTKSPGSLWDDNKYVTEVLRKGHGKKMNHIRKYFTFYGNQKPRNPRLSTTYEQCRSEGTYTTSHPNQLVENKAARISRRIHTHTNSHIAQSLHTEGQR